MAGLARFVGALAVTTGTLASAVGAFLRGSSGVPCGDRAAHGFGRERTQDNSQKREIPFHSIRIRTRHPRGMPLALNWEDSLWAVVREIKMRKVAAATSLTLFHLEITSGHLWTIYQIYGKCTL